MYAQQLISARKRLLSFTGNDRYSVLKTSSSSRAPTTSPLSVTSKTSDVDPNLVLSISFSSCSFRCNLCLNFQCRSLFTFLYCGSFTPLFFFPLPFSVLLLFVSGRLRIWRGVVEDLSIFYSFVEGFFKGPRYCSLGFFIDPREKGVGGNSDHGKGTMRWKWVVYEWM